MELLEANRKILADEFTTVARLINEEKDALRRTYYFSGAYAVVQRVLNIEFHNELILMHSILNGTYQALDSRLKSIMSGGERVINLPSNVFELLSSALNHLGDAISKGGDTYEPLVQISTISYVTTGNGYYLYCKGILKLPE